MGEWRDYHEKMPDGIRSLAAILPHLCSRAVKKYKGFQSDVCQKCESQCGYGRKALKLIGADTSVKSDYDFRSSPIGRAEMLPSLRARIFHRMDGDVK